MLHNIAPHQHTVDESGNSTTTFFIENQIVKEFLELVFNSDIGEGHLENIQLEEDIREIDLDNPLIPIIKCNIEPTILVTNSNTHQFKSWLAYDFSYNSLNLKLLRHKRGPPSGLS